MKKYLVFSFLLISIFMVSGNICYAFEDHENLVQVSFDLNNILRAKHFDNTLKTITEDLENKFAEYTGIDLKMFKMQYNVITIKENMYEYVILRGKLNPDFLKMNLEKKYSSAVSERVINGVKFLTLNNYGIMNISKNLNVAGKIETLNTLITEKIKIENFNTAKSVNFNIHHPEYLELFNIFRPVSEAILLSTNIKGSLSKNRYKFFFKTSSSSSGKLKSLLKENFKYEYEYVDNLNKDSGFNFWSRNMTMFIRTAYIKRKGSKVYLSGKFIEKSEELVLRYFLPFFKSILDEISGENEIISCNQNRDKINAFLSLSIIENKNTGREFRNFMRRNRNIRCPSGGKFSLNKDINNNFEIKCSVHDR